MVKEVIKLGSQCALSFCIGTAAGQVIYSALKRDDIGKGLKTCVAIGSITASQYVNYKMNRDIDRYFDTKIN